ncbi:MAG: hypothetical protein MJZ79_00280 [Paludibacteraceae bacterium]|nr:hypothetical protein [Paludibacteraceae bacterium]
MVHAPYTYKEAFARLDRNLKKDEKLSIATMSSELSELHMGLGMWIRNHWIYGHPEFLQNEHPKTDTDFTILFMPDRMSEELLRQYRRHLRTRYKITSK